VRELTGLGRNAATPSDNRVEAYRIGRQMLIDAGYKQVSLRMFSRVSAESESAPIYCCQSDGMVGLGCGARSYTREIHYSTEFAVGRSGVRSILGEYMGRESDAFRYASYGYSLDGEDQRRRYVILSLLQSEGLQFGAYFDRFRSKVFDDLPQLWELVQRELAVQMDDQIRLTPAGIEMSDAIGPWLYSKRALQLMEEFECH
jgi:oxygen-independent coproporphyrinogen-3 oxidase